MSAYVCMHCMLTRGVVTIINVTTGRVLIYKYNLLLFNAGLYIPVYVGFKLTYSNVV